LDKVISRLVEVENFHLHEYEGGYTDYVREKQFRLKTLQRQFEQEEELLIFESEAIDERRDAAKDPSGAVKRKLADVRKRAEPRPVDVILTDIYEGLHVRDNLLRAEGLRKAYGDRALFDGLSFELHGGDRLAIVGPNGSGKSTLLRVLTGAESPDSGKVAWEGGVGFVSFNQVLAELDPKETVAHAANVTGMAFHAPRKQVGRFLDMLRFSELDQKQRVGTLSGGQRARLALAQCLLSGEQVIVLDEPTNHLDVPSIQVMERALAHYPGAVLMVSHDRFFLDKVATRLLVFEGGRVHEVSGNWTTWQASHGNRGGG
jgi:ATP-binding cassette subfamily F protein 3